MKTKQEITSRLATIKKSLQATNLFTLALRVEDVEKLIKDLPDFQRIDEERFKRIYASKVCDIGLHIKEYNSTLPPALVPLPKEMPYGFSGLFNETHSAKRVWVWITDHYGTPANNLQPLPGVMPALWHDAFTDLLHKRMQPSEFYSLIRKTYGTPDKPNLPTVEELEQDILGIMKMYITDETKSYNVSKHLKNKYSLHPREWWKDCDKFRVKSGNVLVSRGYKVMKDGSAYLLGERTGAYNVKECQHFIEPTIEQKFINSLTPEQMVMYKELNNENHNSGK